MSEFNWTDDLVREFAFGFLFANNVPAGESVIKAFKESKQPKPEWKVLVVKYINRETFWHIQDFSEYDWAHKVLNKIELFEIWKVERLTDNEIFTAGDVVQEGTIGALYINNGAMYVAMNHLNRVFNLNYIHKKEQHEPEYEILEFLNTGQNIILKKGSDNRFRYKEQHDGNGLDFLLSLSHFKIYSVKRLSDGEVFTIVDRTKQGIIQNLKLCNGNILSDFDKGSAYCTLNLIGIEKVEQPKPLFTTEDGVPVFSDTKIWAVNDQLEHWSLNGITATGLLKYFSTESAAEEYILPNKPLLSFYDIDSNIQLTPIQKSILKVLLISKI